MNQTCYNCATFDGDKNGVCRLTGAPVPPGGGGCDRWQLQHTGDQATIQSLTRPAFRAWREGFNPLFVELDRVRIHIEPDADLSAAYEALQAVFVRLLVFECQSQREAIEEA